jgi:hypothetical protein
MTSQRPAFGSLTGLRDQGLPMNMRPQDVPNADFLGAGTPEEQAQAQRDEAAVAALPPTRMIIESHLP